MPGLGGRSQLAPFRAHEVVQEPLTVLLEKEEAQPHSSSSIGASHGFSRAHPGAPSASAGLGAPPHAAALQEVPWSNFERLWPRGGRGMPSQRRRWCSDGCAASRSMSLFEEGIKDEDSIPKPLLEGCLHCFGGIWVNFSVLGVFMTMYLSVLGWVGMCFHPSCSSLGHFWL